MWILAVNNGIEVDKFYFNSEEKANLKLKEIDSNELECWVYFEDEYSDEILNPYSELGINEKDFF